MIDPNIAQLFQDDRYGQNSNGAAGPKIPELTGISPIKRDAALEKAAKELVLGSVAHNALGAAALPDGPQTSGAGLSGFQAYTTEVTFPKTKVIDLDNSDTIEPEGSSTPLPKSPKSALQAETTITPLPKSPQAESTEHVQ